MHSNFIKSCRQEREMFMATYCQILQFTLYCRYGWWCKGKYVEEEEEGLGEG